MSDLGGVRRSQLVGTYGVGAMIAAGDVSVMVSGIDRWPVSSPDLHEARLERQLGVIGFVNPPSGEKGDRDIPVFRFPSIVQCPECERIANYDFIASGDLNRCNACEVPLVPSRFVVACENGHIDDFPYFEWVHKGSAPDPTIKDHKLYIRSRGTSAALRDIVVECSCGLKRSMEDAFDRQELSRFRCKGRRPWLNDEVDCKGEVRTLQRGASNVYFPKVASAISIPPWSEGAYKVLNAHWNIMSVIPEGALEATIRGLKLSEQTGYAVENLVEAVRRRREGAEKLASAAGSIRPDEFKALSFGHPERPGEDFACRTAPGMAEVSDLFEQTMVVTRLREVRALTGFTRLQPPAAESDERLSPLSPTKGDWLPAVEVRGEGVFFRLHEEPLRDWERRTDVRERADRVRANYADLCRTQKREPKLDVTARFLLTHTFAHALIAQWALDCGYPAAALRERLYVAESGADNSMAGLLVYTATSDSAGSLGGVVAQADRGRLRSSVMEALRRASWCSADPLCVESYSSGADGLNLAACHACVLLPETSCEEQNLFLDRAMLCGTPEVPDLGYFHRFLGGE